LPSTDAKSSISIAHNPLLFIYWTWPSSPINLTQSTLWSSTDASATGESELTGAGEKGMISTCMLPYARAQGAPIEFSYAASEGSRAAIAVLARDERAHGIRGAGL
jgi:hypothetical protein